MLWTLSIFLKLLEHFVKVLIGISAIINHYYIDNHHTLCRIGLFLDLILSLLKCYDSFKYWLSALLAREPKDAWWNCWNRDWSIISNFTWSQEPVNCLSENIDALMSFAFIKDGPNNIGNLFALATEPKWLYESDISLFKRSTIYVHHRLAFVLKFLPGIFQEC